MSNKEAVLYHGSKVVVEKPQILISGFYKDFGYGFYCTKLEKQARKWALTKRGASIVSLYNYEPAEDLKILSFPVMTDEWLDFVVDTREAFWVLVKFKYPTHQIVFCTQKSLDSINFKESISL
jgi:hypothetical protein